MLAPRVRTFGMLWARSPYGATWCRRVPSVSGDLAKTASGPVPSRARALHLYLRGRVAGWKARGTRRCGRLPPSSRPPTPPCVERTGARRSSCRRADLPRNWGSQNHAGGIASVGGRARAVMAGDPCGTAAPRRWIASIIPQRYRRAARRPCRNPV